MELRMTDTNVIGQALRESGGKASFVDFHPGLLTYIPKTNGSLATVQSFDA